MHVVGLVRYPVKSLLGESLSEVAVAGQGLVGDRQFALYDAATGFGLTARRAPELLFASARVRADGSAEITLPDGTQAADDAALSAWLGRAVELRAAVNDGALRYENVDDFEREGVSTWSAFEGASGAFHDSSRARVSLLSQATIGAWDVRRFRPNILLDEGDEDALVGRAVTVGSAALEVGMRIRRCVMTTRAQGGGVAPDLEVLRAIARERSGFLAVGALVAHGGIVRVGDRLTAA